MISINIFEIAGEARSHVAAYNWPNQPLPAGRIIGKQGNALLMELVGGSLVAVISAPRSVVIFADEGLPVVDLDWAFAS
jgi:hypothetical protein